MTLKIAHHASGHNRLLKLQTANCNGLASRERDTFTCPMRTMCFEQSGTTLIIHGLGGRRSTSAPHSYTTAALRIRVHRDNVRRFTDGQARQSSIALSLSESMLSISECRGPHQISVAQRARPDMG